VCMYGAGTVVGETFLTMARTGASLGSNSHSFTAVMPANPGDSGSPVVRCGAEGTSGVHGTQPVGIVTHGVGAVVAGVPLLAWGTTVTRAQQMTTEAGLNIQLVIAS
ncbi:MAG TPA: hypothetical protein VM582_08230, partial [Candidatus Thermoplasmatota archaeon]|nr:hypothetical protein [Candidatus Thermoplasmatota archaeon]